jgi:NAD(P)-dependent dehydrogenase (short-subunit alcohol dehydrogenase family)
LVEAFLREGYNVVATSLNASNASQLLTASTSLVLVDGDIGQQETVLVNNAGIYRTKPFITASPLRWRTAPDPQPPGDFRLTM